MYFFFNDTATTEIYTLSLHDALPILLRYVAWRWSVPLPANGLAEAAWSHAFLVLESLSVLSNLLVLFFMSRTLDRSPEADAGRDRKSTRLNSSHANISYAVFCLKKKN